MSLNPRHVNDIVTVIYSLLKYSSELNMRRKPNEKDYISSSPQTIKTNNNRYRKRLRSWKQTSSQLKSNHLTALVDDEITPPRKSTIYTYPISFSNDRQSNLSSTALSESVTSESAFCCSSMTYNSVKTVGNLNNNRMKKMLNTGNKKRKNNSISCESFSSYISQIKTLEILHNPNDEMNNNTDPFSNDNPQLTYLRSPVKRSRLSTDDSSITDHRSENSSLVIDEDTIDINQQESLPSSINNEYLINKADSMKATCKMVQPIVDIIFNAFDDQLKNFKSIPHSTTIPSSQFYSPVMIPCFPLTSPARPIALHSVNFNIQLTTKQQTVNPIEKQNFSEQYLTNAPLNENDHLQGIPRTEFKQKMISFNLIADDHETNDSNQRRKLKLKRFVQVVACGVSVLCSYLLL